MVSGGFGPKMHARIMTTKSGLEFLVDAFAVGVGIRRQLAFLKDSEIEVGSGGIRTNEFLETNKEDVYAAGDVAEFYDVSFGIHHIIGNWTNAVLQGKRAGLNMTGERIAFKNIPSYSITNLGLQITSLGLCSNTLETIVRIDDATRQYERFFIQNGVLVGAVLINRFGDKTHLTQLIEKKVSIEPYREELQSFQFDIHTIAT